MNERMPVYIVEKSVIAWNTAIVAGQSKELKFLGATKNKL
jgi:hypothetical protein